MTDQLSAPLGRKKQSRRGDLRSRISSLPFGRIMIGLALLIAGVVGLTMLLVDRPDGGRPVSEIEIAQGRAPDIVTSEPDALETIDDMPGENPSADGLSLAGAGPIEAIDIPALDLGDVPNAAELNAFGALPALVEETQNGPIPRIAENGDTPFATYSRPSVTSGGAGGKPLIALIITGMGLSESSTFEAATRLPGGVTMAFAPYGRSLPSTSAAARASGHELMLQVPLEPFDYPENDPGPQTLLTGHPPRANLDKLLFLLARLGGYTGVINHMGARFTASAPDFGPIIEELATRGLGYVDDGSSNRSLAASMARGNHVPFARADKIVDATPSRAAILDSLEELEAIARENGKALGVATALPVSIDTIAEWTAGLEEKGFVLVPASAVMGRP